MNVCLAESDMASYRVVSVCVHVYVCGYVHVYVCGYVHISCGLMYMCVC